MIGIERAARFRPDKFVLRSAGGVPAVGKRNKGPSQLIVVRRFERPRIRRWQVVQSAKRYRTQGGTAIKEMPTFRGDVEIALIAEVGHGPSLFDWLTLQSIHSPNPRLLNPAWEVRKRQSMTGAFPGLLSLRPLEVAVGCAYLFLK